MIQTLTKRIHVKNFIRLKMNRENWKTIRNKTLSMCYCVSDVQSETMLFRRKRFSTEVAFNTIHCMLDLCIFTYTYTIDSQENVTEQQTPHTEHRTGTCTHTQTNRPFHPTTAQCLNRFE